MGRSGGVGGAEEHLVLRQGLLRSEPAAADQERALVNGGFEDGFLDSFVAQTLFEAGVLAPVDFDPLLERLVSDFHNVCGPGKSLTNMPAEGAIQLATSVGRYFSQAANMLSLRRVYSKRR